MPDILDLGDKREKTKVSGAFDGNGQGFLVLGAGPGSFTAEDAPMFGKATVKHGRLFIIRLPFFFAKATVFGGGHSQLKDLGKLEGDVFGFERYFLFLFLLRGVRGSFGRLLAFGCSSL